MNCVKCDEAGKQYQLYYAGRTTEYISSGGKQGFLSYHCSNGHLVRVPTEKKKPDEV